MALAALECYINDTGDYVCGTYTQAATAEVGSTSGAIGVNVACGFVPSRVRHGEQTTLADAWVHFTGTTAGTSFKVETMAAVTTACTLRDDFAITGGAQDAATAVHIIKPGSTVANSDIASGATVNFTGFSLGATVDGDASDVVFFEAWK